MAVNAIGLPWFAVLVKIGALAGLSSVVLVLMYGQTRIFYTMSRDGLVPQSLAAVHPRFKTPWINTLIVGAIVCAASGFLSLDVLGDGTNGGSLAAFALVCITVMYLRWRSPDLVRPFRTPLYPFTPIMGALMCAVLLMSLIAVPVTRNFFLVYLAIGVVVYFAYGIRHSRLSKGLAATPAE